MINKIEKQYVSFEVAQALKEAKFNVPCKMCGYEDDPRPMLHMAGKLNHMNSMKNFVSIPEQWVVEEWLRVNFGVHFELLVDGTGDGKVISDEMLHHRMFIYMVGQPRPKPHEDLGGVESIVEAKNICILAALELIKRVCSTEEKS